MRPNTELQFEYKLEEKQNHIIGLLKGAFLAVFNPSVKKTIQTKMASIGIRGSACYSQIEKDSMYFCLCYGEAEIKTTKDLTLKDNYKTNHHENPIIISIDGQIEKTIVKDHQDRELIYLEWLVERKVPFNEDFGSSY